MVRPHAPKVDRTPSLKPSTNSAHTPNQSILPTSPPSHAGAPTITKTASSQTRTARGVLPGDPSNDARNGGASSEVPHPPDEVKGSAYPSEQVRSSPSASPHKPPLPSGRAAPTAGSPSQPQPVTGPRSLDRSNSRIQGNEGVEREAKRATEGSTLDKTERKRTAAPKEHESHQENSATDSYNAQRRKPESSPPSSFASISATRSLSKDSVGALSKDNPTGSSVDTNSRPPTAVGNSEIRATPSFSRTMSSRVSVPIAPITSQASQRKGESRSGPILPSKSVGQPSPAIVPPVPQKGPYAGSLRKATNDTSSGLPEDRHHGKVDSPQGAIDNKPQAKLSDGVGLAQQSGASSFGF